MAIYTIQIQGMRNEQTTWPPLNGTMLRGTWRHSRGPTREKNEAMQFLSRIESIPGIHVWIDTNKRSAGIYDPLVTTDEGKRIWSEIKRILDQHQGSLGGPFEPWEPLTKSKLNNDEMKLWIHHMRAAVDRNMAIYVEGSGELPALDEVAKLPGRRLADPNDSSPRAKAAYTDVVESGSKTAT